MSRTIYVSLDALTSATGSVDPNLMHGVASYAQPFLHWCAEQGRTVLLTDRPLAHAFRLLAQLNADNGTVSVRTFDSSKTEILRSSEDFYLVDDALIPGEASWFTEHGLGDRIIAVDPHTGVTPETRRRLEEKFHGRRKH